MKRKRAVSWAFRNHKGQSLYTRRALLTAAEEVFAIYGYAGAPTRTIVQLAGVNISSLHYHWGSKDRLYAAVFEQIYQRITEVVQEALRSSAKRRRGRLETMTTVMGALVDFFFDHPTVPRLLARRLLENEDEHAEIEQRILKPAWRTFSRWVRNFGGKKAVLSEQDANLFMLTVEGALLLLLLDSPHVTALLGRPARSPRLRARVRQHLVELVPTLLKHAQRQRR